MNTASADVRRLFARQNGLCHWCDEPMLLDAPHNAERRATRDHVFPRNDPRRNEQSSNGRTIRNVCACRKCNTQRGDLPYDVFLVLKRPEWRGALDIAATATMEA